MKSPLPWARRLRRTRVGIYLLLSIGTAYGLWRFDVVRLPEGGCSPLSGFEPGDRLLVDRGGAIPAPGDALLFRAADGELLLGRVAEAPPSAPQAVWSALRRGSLWIRTERADCPGPDSRTLGPIDPSAVVGRIVVALPW